MTIIEAERIKMRFGRWQGFSLGEIAGREVSYFDYLASISDMLDLHLREAVKLMCEKHGRSAKRVNVKSAGQKELF